MNEYCVDTSRSGGNPDDLINSTERFQTLFKATKDAIWDWDLITDKTWWNDNLYLLLGYDPVSPVPSALEWTKRVHPTDRIKVMARLKSVTNNVMLSWEDEFRLRLPNGSYITVLDRGYVLKDISGIPIRVIGTLVNITEQKQLVREMELLSLIARESDSSVIIFNSLIAGALWVNVGFTRLTGYSSLEVYEKNPWMLMRGPETDMKLLSFMTQHIQDNLPFACDLIIYTKKGESRWQSVIGQPIQEHHGTSNNYFVIATDISERKRIEERQTKATLLLQETLKEEGNYPGREFGRNINQILETVNMQLSHFIENPDNNMEVLRICREEVRKAIEEPQSLPRRDRQVENY
jgi:PAS domain S-box-containing protein